jgi:hypothetical protein
MATRKTGPKSSPGKRTAARRSADPTPEPRTYDHPEAKTLLRHDVGTQASFRKKKPPRTYHYDDLKRSLKGQFDDSVWDHLAGTKSEPFEGGEHRQVAVKVMNDRGNELFVVKTLRQAE